MVTAISVTLTPTHTHTHTPFSSCHEHDRARGSAWATSDLKHPIISHSIAGGRRGERLLVVVVVVVEGGGCPFSASPSPHVTASCIDCWAWWWRGPGWWKGGLFLSRMLYWSLAPSHTQPHTHTHTHTWSYRKIFITYKEARKHNQAILQCVGVHFVGSVTSGFVGWQSPSRRWELVWSASRAGGGAGMVIPLTPGFLRLTCGAPDQMGVLFLGSPQVQPLIRSCSSIGAEQNALEAFPWTPSSSSKLPSLIHHPPAPGHSSILFSPSLPLSLSLSLSDVLSFPLPGRALSWPLCVNWNGSGHPPGHLRGGDSGYRFWFVKFFFFFFFSHTCWRMDTTAHTRTLTKIHMLRFIT